jgi:hypothetical protein
MYLSTVTTKKSKEDLILEGLPARYCVSGKMRIVVVSLDENQSGVWDAGEFFYITGIQLTKELIETSYVEVDSVTTAFTSKFEVKLIPEIFFI